MLARQLCRRLLLSGFATRPHAMRGRCSHVIAGIAYCPRVGPPYRARCVVCVTTSSLSSFAIDGFDTLLRSMCGLRSHVIAGIASYCRVSGPVATTIAVRNVHTNCSRIWPAIARIVWSVLSRHRYRRLSLTGSTPCRARCVVFVRTSSLSSHVIIRFPALLLLLSPRGMFTPIVPRLGPLSRAMCGLC